MVSFEGAYRGVALLGTAISLTMLGGCSQVRNHRGYIADPVLVAAVQPGIDNQQSVARTLGTPSFTSEFGRPIWYYVSTDTQEFAFNNPHPVAHSVLAISFDPSGNVTAVERKAKVDMASISPNGDKTPTLGRNRTILDDIFGNIGTVGAPGAGGAGGAGGNGP